MPIPELERADGDTVIVFLSGNGVLFDQASDDDWYLATVPNAKVDSRRGSEATPTYRPLNAASPMGCVQQMQWCNSKYPRDRGCGPLASAYDAFLGAAPLFNLTEEELNDMNFSRPVLSKAAGARLTWTASIILNSPASSLDQVLATLGANALTSQSYFYNGIQLPLSGSQWQDDVAHWWRTTLASVQATFMLATVSLEPLTEQENKMCHSQVCYLPVSLIRCL
jgi:hypothetical protein